MYLPMHYYYYLYLYQKYFICSKKSVFTFVCIKLVNASRKYQFNEKKFKLIFSPLFFVGFCQLSPKRFPSGERSLFSSTTTWSKYFFRSNRIVTTNHNVNNHCQQTNNFRQSGYYFRFRKYYFRWK